MSAGESRIAFITGVTGQDGSYLAELLIQKGYVVHGLVRRSSSSNLARIAGLLQAETSPSKSPSKKTPQLPSKFEPRFVLHHGDVTDSARLQSLMLRIRPDEVYHLAAQSHVQVSFENPLLTAEVTGLGTVRMLDAVRELADHKPIRFYQASSSEMFGTTRTVPQNESTPFHPRSPYACAKVLAFHQVVNYREAYGLFACNGILFNHESPRRSAEFVTRKVTLAAARIRRGQQSRLRLGNLAARRDWGYAPEYVQAMWQMMQIEKPDDFVVATGETHSVADLCELAFKTLGMDYRDHVDLDESLQRRAEVGALQGDSRKAAAAIGWSPMVRFESLIPLMVQADLHAVETNSVPAW